MQNLNKVISKIDVLLPPVEYIKSMLGVICDSLGYSFASVIEMDDAGEGKMLVAYNLPENYPEKVNQVIEPVLSSPSGEAIETGRIVVVTNPYSEPRLRPWYELMQEYSIQTEVWVPIFRKGKGFGVYVLYDTKKRNLPEEELAVLEQIGVMVSIAITSNRYLSELSTEIEERKIVEQELRQIRDGLKTQVESRATELSKANLELQLFRNLIDQSNDAIYVIEPETGCFLDFNEKACLNFGCKREDMLGKTILDIAPFFSDISMWVQHVEKVKEKGHLTFMGTCRRKDDTVFPVEINVNYVTIEPDEYLVSVVRDISKCKQTEAALKESEKQYHLLFDSACDAIFIHDMSDRFIQVNDVACESLGYSREELLQMTSKDIVSKEYIGGVAQLIERIQKGGESIIESAHVTKDGTIIPVEISSRLIEYAGKPCFLDIVHDIAERKRMQKALKSSYKLLEKRVVERTEELERINKELSDANIKLLDVDRMKSDFLDTISHELRTPLTSIIGYSSLLLDGIQGDLNEKQTQYVDGIWRKGMHQLQLVNDILDVSKLESNRMTVNPESVSVSKTITDTMADIMPLIKDKQHETVIEIADGVGDVCADGVRLKQVLLNLISNAIKFTPDAGRIVIKAENMGEMVRISVIDNGIGIKDKDIAKLFNRFIQIDQSNTRSVGGTGLGLAIVKDMMDLMNGSVELKSEFGKGTMFSILLPKATEKNCQ